MFPHGVQMTCDLAVPEEWVKLTNKLTAGGNGTTR